jgi:hypothetical protein
MKEANQEIDYVDAILTMRTMLSLNNFFAHKLKIDDAVHFEVADLNCSEKQIANL